MSAVGPETCNRIYRSPADSVTTTPTPLGYSSVDDHLGEKIRLEAHIAAKGIHAYVAELGQGSNPAYRAWEEVRNNRAAELVGKVFGSDGKPLPYTGFEGYFVGESPTRIVEIETSLGERILRSVHYNFGVHEAPSGLREHEVIAALYGEKMSPSHVHEILEFFDCLFKEILAQAKAIASPEKYEHFQAGTYQRVESGQTLTEHVNPLTSVTIATPRETKAYDTLAQIGIFGHPGLRAMHEPEHERIAVGASNFAKQAFPVPAGSLDVDDNPLSR